MDKHTSDHQAVEHEDPQSALDSVIRNIVEVLGGGAGAVSLFNDGDSAADVTSSYGLTKNALAGLQPLIVKAKSDLKERLDSGPGFTDLEGSLLKTEKIERDLGSRMVMLPFRIQDRIVGLLCLFGLPDDQQFLANPGTRNSDEPNQMEIVNENIQFFQRLVEEKQWLETIIQYNADGIVVIDGQHRIIGFNSTLASLTGWKASDVWGKNCCEVLKFKTRSGIDWCTRSCPLSGTSDKTTRIPAIELLMTTRDAREIDVEASYAIIRANTGNVLGGIIDIRDIRARREAEELQSTFLSVISHELQTPIAIIEGYASLLGEENNKIRPEEMRQKLGIIKEESSRLSKLVERLLYASRIQANGITLHVEPLDLIGLVKRVSLKMAGMSSKHSITNRMPADLPSVLADYDQLEEVMMNLIENAIKYSPRGGSIIIDAEAQADFVIIGVNDEGEGIPEKDRDHIFERFSRLDTRLVRQIKGTGLGLFICKSIVEAHGGKIWVESSPLHGARFRFSIPRELRQVLPARVIDIDATK